MYYLKYRPNTVAGLDNTQVKGKIQHILKPGEIPHAMLFVGPKGMGKTSTARIVAKAVNCLNNVFAGKGTSSEPCNECLNCTGIDKGSSPDVVEQDAASNRGIEEVRKLIREASFAPMMGRYRIYIIDEAHMITPDAFNALLKTLEEPPETVIFILATTNEEKVPTTIISRCVRISFGQATKADIFHMLGRMADQENLDISDDIKEVIYKYSENSFRDAAKLLEELVTQEKLTKTEAEQYLGVNSKYSLLTLMKTGSLAEALQWVESFASSGGNIKLILEDLLRTLQQQLLLKSGVETETEDLGFDIAEITKLMKLFHEAYKNHKISPIETLPLEIAVVEFYNLKK